MKLLLDMNLSPRWRGVLAAAGHDATHWSEVGDSRAADADIMGFAEREGFTVLTHDLDFGAILAATTAGRPSVIQLRGDDISPEASAATVLTAIADCQSDLEAGALLTIDLTRFRLTLLPLGGRRG